MQRKWFGKTDSGNPEESHNGNGNAKTSEIEEKSNRAPEVSLPVTRPATEVGDESNAPGQIELLPMEEIYRVAGILNSRRGYTIIKVVDMLRSEHVRGLSKEQKRAALLMALDAAGIPIDELLEDAKVRQEAIDSYEAEQRKLFEAEWARKAEENAQIQAELERVKARYMDRLRRNLDGVAREKATFGSWLTMKQQEAQNMAEAAELCAKPVLSEAARGSLATMTVEDAIAKPM